MDCIWLIFDSLSYEATPFGDSGPDKMPRLEALASDSGVVFENAYLPGPARVVFRLVDSMRRRMI